MASQFDANAYAEWILRPLLVWRPLIKEMRVFIQRMTA